MRNLYRRRLKRPLDFVGAAVLLTVTSPLQAACAVAVIASSGRPVFFHQERIGLHGKPFRIHKFRTMRNGTEERSGNYPTSSMVTPVGRWLRRTSLDELPQLFNILAGEMSFVGPRPALASQVVRYTAEQRERLEVLPGVTGLAQIEHRNSAPWSVRIATDREYLRTISFVNDLRIILLTIPSALRADGQVIGQTASDVDDLAPTPIQSV